MTTKYKELPAFETNEFKVGDMVSYYSDDVHMFTDFIIEIEGNLLIMRNTPRKRHFKQCRKLEEIKPREFYLYLLGQGEYTTLHPVHQNLRSIKVREVIE